MSLTPDEVKENLLQRSKEMMERINVRFRNEPGFASDVGANFFDWLLEDLTTYAEKKDEQ